MNEFVSASSDYSIVEAEPTELAARNVLTGVHLWASATVFFFADFVFAYFYLRALNNGGMWRPKHVDTSLTLGTLVMACVVAASVLVALGLRDQRAERRPEWRLKGMGALALLTAAIGLQVAAWATQDFGPADGAFASVYVGWTAMLFVFLLGTMYWLETIVATAIRYRKVPIGGLPPAGHASGDPHRTASDIADPISLVRPALTAFNFYLQFLAGIVVISWVILYLV